MSTVPANVIAEGLDEIVALLEAAGIPTTRDPGAFQPPGAIVGAPTVLTVTQGGGLGLWVPVFLVTPDTGQAGIVKPRPRCGLRRSIGMDFPHT